MPKAYTYSRASSKDRDDVSNSVPHQVKRTRQYYEMMLEDTVEWGEAIIDESVSASKVRFDDRPGGRKLVGLLQRGDHLIFDKLDRMWRSVLDFERLNQWMDRRGVTWHVVNQGGISIDTSQAAGKAMVTIMMAFAEMEASLASERQMASVKIRREQGRLTGVAPIGMKAVAKVVGGDKKFYLEWDQDQRATMQVCVKLLNEHPTDQGAHDAFCAMLAKKAGRHWSPKWIGKRPITINTMKNWYRREMQYRELASEGILSAGDVAAEIYNRGWTARERANGPVNPDHQPANQNLRIKRTRERKQPVAAEPTQIMRDLMGN